MNIHYLGCQGAVLVFGVDPVKPALVVGRRRWMFVIAIRSAPHDGGLFSEDAMLINFIIGVSVNLASYSRSFRRSRS